MSFTLAAVIGRPILHSRSPEIHREAMRIRNVDGCYIRLSVQSVCEAVTVLRQMNAVGCNVTAPFKEDAFHTADQTDALSAQLQAANTLRISATEVVAFNTDVAGVKQCVRSAFPRADRYSGVIFGTGPAARAALIALSELEWNITIVGRDQAKLDALARLAPSKTVSTNEWDQALPGAALLISCVPSNELHLPEELLTPELSVLDAVYGKESELLRAAKRRGCIIIPGTSWLLHQASDAFTHFTDRSISPEEIAPSCLSTTSYKRKSVALIGFMGSGKSTIAPLLAKQLGLPAADLDSKIEAHEGCSIPEIFRHKGENYFRELESDVLASILEPSVIACGGGTTLREESRNILAECALTIWLWSSAGEIKNRLARSSNRPLFNANATESMLLDRIPYYAKPSDLVISTDHSAPSEIVERICYEIHSTRTN